ncbi:hypothetical protein [Jatrophihabitans endophyticus]|uniref:hypothetical protein n=1 Tax=Jatrophihabitans endophyticus TaxID=1206085 RepID=UPI0019E6D905|nr:hypothetical protein [Jatrophihabitans endophyticus]MBE7189261.1 hypothetical protein [Jatrophihabitans endophyticus]
MLVLGPVGAGAARADAQPHVLFHLQDPRIDEASGLGVGMRSKGIDYVENDSGDTNRFFALDARTGATAAVVTVPDATNVDWEDLQVAPDAAGTPSVWLADIGDNDSERAEVQVYRVPEPHVRTSDRDVAITSARPAVWRLRYPDGPTDAESLAVTPAGRAYVVTKNVFGQSAVYAVPARPDAHRVRTLTRVGTIRFAPTPGSSPVGAAGSVLATSAAISRNGLLLAVRTYVYADVWRLHPHGASDGVAAALRGSPTRVKLPRQRQGEGLAIAGGRLLLDSEGVGSAVKSVRLPAGLRGLAHAPISSVASPVTTAAPATATPATTAPDSPTPTRSPSTSHGSKYGGLSVLVVVVLLGAVLLLGRRARRYGDGDGRG